MVTLGARGRHSSWPLSWLVRTRLARSEGLPRRLRASSARGPISAAPWNQPTTWWQASNSEASSIRSCSWSHGALLPQRDCVQGQPEPQRQLLRGQAGPLADLADRSSDGPRSRAQPARRAPRLHRARGRPGCRGLPPRVAPAWSAVALGAVVQARRDRAAHQDHDPDRRAHARGVLLAARREWSWRRWRAARSRRWRLGSVPRVVSTVAWVLRVRSGAALACSGRRSCWFSRSGGRAHGQWVGASQHRARVRYRSVNLAPGNTCA